MNFDVYEINKIFYDQISSLSSHPRKYGFRCWGTWDSPKFNHNFCISCDLYNVNRLNWLHDRNRFYKEWYLSNMYSIYKIDRNRFLRRDIFESRFFESLFFLENQETVLSLRELILFMIYMRYISSRV